MDIQIALLIGGTLIGIASYVTYRIGKAKSNGLFKYIPAIGAAFAIVIFYLKTLFISKGYEGIFDMIVIIFLAYILVISIVVAIIIEIINRRK